ncbi:PREDICTED: probable malate dehydrogenase, mitochondrial [Vollenhovia emeryi]|uniref:probable malate dehydrogenase, mitochondrial n=1 Tax=Vollenhovia emeryi TaxID=411798 RepID=UPI0005F55304|nr:PREDICTED: probable malate dehydrogenase, mitochondrial [Vollenhovia emeryi]
MTVLSRSCLDLSRRCGRRFTLARRGSSKIPPADERTVQRVEEKNAEGSTRREKDENARRGDESGVKVCIIGGGVTPLYTAVLLKQYRIIKSIRLVDTRDSALEALTDASHLETSPRIDHFRRKDIKQALREVRASGNTDRTENFLADLSKKEENKNAQASIVALMDETDVAAAGSAMAREQFKSTADYVRQMTDRILRFCPDAVVAVFARPVTATLAMVSEICRCAGWWNPDRLVGSTASYGGRIEGTAAAILNLERASLSVPLAGGADVRTVVPLLSRAVPFNQFTNVRARVSIVDNQYDCQAQRKTLLESLRAGDEGVRTGPLGEGSSLSSGTAAAGLLLNLAAGLSGHERVVTCAYVRSDVLPVCRFFTSELELGPEGVKRNLGLPKISAGEVHLIEQAIPLINEHVDMAVAAVRTERTRARTR